MWVSSLVNWLKHPHLKIYKVKRMHPTERFSALVELLKLIQPTAIMTEIEFDIVSVYRF